MAPHPHTTRSLQDLPTKTQVPRCMAVYDWQLLLGATFSLMSRDLITAWQSAILCHYCFVLLFQIPSAHCEPNAHYWLATWNHKSIYNLVIRSFAQCIYRAEGSIQHHRDYVRRASHMYIISNVWLPQLFRGLVVRAADVVGSIPVTTEFIFISCDSNLVPKWFGTHYNLEVPL